MARRTGRTLRRTILTAGAAGLAAGAYGSLIERNAFTVRRVSVPVLPAGSKDIRILHLSDIHMMPGQRRKQDWLRSLATLQPDLVVNTGDNLSHPESVGPVLDALGPLLEFPGVFVFGSNDYFAPTAHNPLKYFQGPSRKHRGKKVPDLPWQDLRDGLTERGWANLTHAKHTLDVRGSRLSFAGVDDPHLGWDDLDAVAGPADPGADLPIAVTHAPYLRVLDAFTRDAYRLILAGHTHGGQLAVPGWGALVTNCDLDTRRAKGLHTHAVAGLEPAWLHVSAGCGTSPYAPIRFACRPEATLLTLVALDSGGA